MLKISGVNSIMGEFTVPGDKSISHRTVMLGSLAEGTTEIRGFLMAEDCLRTVDCFRKMGIEIEISGGKDVLVYGKGLYGLEKPSEVLYAGNSGTTMRLLLGILAGQSFEAKITGDNSLNKRPMARVTKPLRLMGAEIEGRDDANLAPLKIKGGQLKGIEYTLPIASAQVKSALLLAGLYARGKTRVIEPYRSRNHTELMLEHMGANIEVDNKTVTIFKTDKLKASTFYIPGDISSAAYFIVACCILPGSSITIKDVGVNPTRTGILDVLNKMGARIELKNKRVRNGEPIADISVQYSPLKSTVIQGDIIPRLIDEIPVLAVAGAFARGTTVVKDAAELKVKESNRIKSIVEGLKKMGARIEETSDGFVIRGGRELHPAEVDSYGDHRIAMSLAIAALRVKGVTGIKDWECVNVSFPGFAELLDKVQQKA